MDSRFLIHNHQYDHAKDFSEVDPNLHQLKSHHFVFQFEILEKFPVDFPGVYTLYGSHQVGKTTLLKQWVEKLLTKGISEKAIVFFPAELIKDYHDLQQLLKKQIEMMPSDNLIYLIIDDVNLIRDWEKAILFIENAGLLERVVLMLSSSDLSLKQKVQARFSNQRTQSKQTDFNLYPLSFRETVLLKHQSEQTLDILFDEFNQYLLHGGYLSVINDIAIYGTINDKTLTTFVDWIKNEIVRQGKQERYLHEILSAVIKHYNQQTTWNSLAQELSIDHPKTIGDYFASLEALDLVFVQYALIEETLKPAPKKARKLMFTDPFIFHVIQTWISPGKNYYETQIKPMLDNAELCSKLVETCVITQFRRFYPTYYIKAEGEVDLVYTNEERFWPIETTWMSQIRAKDLKQILKYPNGRILTKTERSGVIEHIRTEPLPLALWQLEDHR